MKSLDKMDAIGRVHSTITKSIIWTSGTIPTGFQQLYAGE
jgi:hypothetical protein